MAGVGTNSAELRAIKNNRSKLVTAITKQGGLNWFSQKLRELDFITSERASGLTGTLGVSEEDKVSSLLEAVEAKIQSNQRGTPFSDFVKLLESESCLQDLGQTLQYECQMIEQASRSDDVISGQIAMSMSEADPSVSRRCSPADSSVDVTTVPSSTSRPASFPMRSVDGSGHVYVRLPEENEENDTDVADEEVTTLHAVLPIGHQQVNVSAPSLMVHQTGALARATHLQGHVGSELRAIRGDIAMKDSQISDLREGQQKQLLVIDELKQKVEEQEKQITALTKEKEKLETEVQEKTEQLTQTNEQLAKEKCQLEECEQNLTREKQAVERLKQQLELELESSRDQLANKEKEVDDVRSEKDKEIAELRKELEEAKKNEARVTELRQAEQQKILELKLELAKKENELLKSQKELAEKDAQLAQKGEELANTKAELTTKECMIAKLQTEKELENHRRSSAEIIEKRDAEIAELSAQLSRIRHTDRDTSCPCIIV